MVTLEKKIFEISIFEIFDLGNLKKNNFDILNLKEFF